MLRSTIIPCIVSLAGFAAPLSLLSQALPAPEAAEIQELDTFAIEGYREGRIVALQQSRDATNTLAVVSADSVGQLPDLNIADAVSRLAGVSTLGDAGEGRFVSIRGINPNLNNVTVNGVRVASSGIRNLDGRDSVSGSAVPLDVIGSAQVSSIEVIKSVTPDMDANAIGGSINLRTVSAFNFPTRTIYGSLTGGYSDQAGKAIYEGDITYADRFGQNDQFAIALSANFSRRPFQLEAFQSVWQTNVPFAPGEFLPQSIELLPEIATRERFGFTGNFEYRPSDGTEVFFRVNYNQFQEDLVRQESVFATTNRQGFRDGPNVAVYTSVRGDVDAYERSTDQNQVNFTGGLIKEFSNDFKLEFQLNYSTAAYDNEKEQRYRFRNANIQTSGFRIDYNQFLLDVDFGDNQVMNLENYRFFRWSEDSYKIREDIYTPQLDLTWERSDVLGARLASFKTGFKFNRLERSSEADRRRWASGDILLSEVSQFVIIPGLTNRGVQAPFDLEPLPIVDYFKANLDRLVFSPVVSGNQTAQDTFSIDEDIYAAYAMATLEYDRVVVLGGFRYERTEATFRGLEHRIIGGQAGNFTTNTVDFSYDNLFPNLQTRVLLTPNLILRAALTFTFARPEYEFATPNSVLNVSTPPVPDDPEFPFIGSLSIGNPQLSPYESTNIDISLEYYLPNQGVLSVGAFHKAIDNPIYPIRDQQFRVIRDGQAFEQLNISSQGNADEATVKGIELAAFLPFSFLPDPFSGFGVDLNATFISSSVTIPGRSDELPFFEQPDRIYNVALFYEYARFAARLAYSYQSASLREIRTDPTNDFYRANFGQLDGQASYRFSENITLFVNAQNLNDASQDTYSGDPSRLRYSRSTGTNYRAGLRFRF
jgi:TonB-dependent receptor